MARAVVVGAITAVITVTAAAPVLSIVVVDRVRALRYVKEAVALARVKAPDKEWAQARDAVALSIRMVTESVTITPITPKAQSQLSNNEISLLSAATEEGQPEIIYGRLYSAEVIGTDPITDIAVLRVEPGAIPPAPIGTSSDLVVGEPAIALGNPFGFVLANAEATVTAGVVSGVGRDILDSREGKLSADMIQTDAAINPGYSGGPLIDAQGYVHGVNTMILRNTEGIGFAIPVNLAKALVDRLLQGKNPGHLGILPVNLTDDMARFLNLPSTRGAFIQRVDPGSPAEEGGLRAKDIIPEFDGPVVNHSTRWPRLFGKR